MIINSDQKDYIIQAILTTVMMGGLMTLAIVAPNVIQLIKPLKKIWRKTANQQKYYINKRTRDLIKKKFIAIDKHGQLSITPIGEEILQKRTIAGKIKTGKQKWDGKWRIIVFDVKEKQRKKRDYFRRELMEAGFIKLQNSVWISPYDNDEFIELLQANLSLRSEVIYLEATKISTEKETRLKFNI